MNYASTFIFNKDLLYFGMDLKVIKGNNHYLYDNMEEYRAIGPAMPVVGSWRQGNEGDWVTTDDEHICQILKKSMISHPNYKQLRTMVRTVCGSFIVEQKSHRMNGEGGVVDYKAIYSRSKDRRLNNREFLFARYVASGDDAISAYKRAYPAAKDNRYIKNKSNILLQKEGIRKMVKEEIKKILEDEGVSPEWIIGQYKTIAEVSDRDANRLRSLEALSKIAGLFDTETKQEQLTVFQGFTPKQLEALQGGKETNILAHAEKSKEK